MPESIATVLRDKLLLLLLLLFVMDKSRNHIKALHLQQIRMDLITNQDWTLLTNGHQSFLSLCYSQGLFKIFDNLKWSLDYMKKSSMCTAGFRRIIIYSVA